MERREALLPQASLRQLSDRQYERRRAAALQVEEVARNLA
jgi:hypothetical protein